MKKGKLAKLAASGLMLSLLAGATACGSSDTTANSANANTAESAAETTEETTKEEAAKEEAAEEAATEKNVITINIATEGAYAPYNYVDADGNPDGYDIAVAKAVDELLEDYEFTYQAVEWSSIFAGLEADKYQAIISQAAKTEEREKKYLFGSTAYCWGVGAIAYQAGRTDIKSMNDLAGKTLSVAVGSSNEAVALAWNEANGNVIDIVYNDGDITKALLDVQEGRVDATLVSPTVGAYVIKENGLNVETVLRDDDTVSPVYFLFSDTEENKKLSALADEALQTLIDNGKLAEISKEYLGEDFSSLEAVESRLGN
jgi:ABC-type amino acid transport substrate-binding protein